MPLTYRQFLFLTAILFSPALLAQQLDCGEPPPVADRELKSNIEGQAKFLTGWLGEAGLSGQLQKSRKEIFSKYPNADKVVRDRYLLYQICIFLKDDTSLTNVQKIQELMKINRELDKPVTTTEN